MIRMIKCRDRAPGAQICWMFRLTDVSYIISTRCVLICSPMESQPMHHLCLPTESEKLPDTSLIEVGLPCEVELPVSNREVQVREQRPQPIRILT